jgi:uncharacterized protein YqgV (UPF0045/DUF77 family)
MNVQVTVMPSVHVQKSQFLVKELKDVLISSFKLKNLGPLGTSMEILNSMLEITSLISNYS